MNDINLQYKQAQSTMDPDDIRVACSGRNRVDITFKIGNDNYTNIDDSCEFINNHFANVGKKLYAHFHNDLLRNDYAKMYNLQSSDEDIFFEIEDIKKIVKCIDVHKGSGIDYLPSFILKDVFEAIPSQLTFLFNKSLSTGFFPQMNGQLQPLLQFRNLGINI